MLAGSRSCCRELLADLWQPLLSPYLLSQQSVWDAAQSEVPGHAVHEAAEAAVVACRLSVEAELNARSEIRQQTAATVLKAAAEGS